MKFGHFICVAGLVVSGAAGTALAGDITFAASGTFEDGATLGGTLVIDTVTGIVETQDVNLNVTGGQAGDGLTFDTLSSQFEASDIDGAGDNVWIMNFTDSAFDNGPVEQEVQVQEDPSLQLEVYLGQATDLTDFTGGSASLCTFDSNNYPSVQCGYYASSYNTNADPLLTAGSLDIASAPEPASLLLLGVPAVWIVRRQRRNV